MTATSQRRTAAATSPPSNRHSVHTLMAVAACVALLGTRGVSHAGQTTDYDAPADSARWWTLSDDTSPSQLRAALLDSTSHRSRLERAIQAGSMQPMTQDQIDSVTFFISGQQTPELVPFWIAFNALSVRSQFSPNWRASCEKLLSEYQLTPAGQEAILGLVLTHFSRAQKDAIALAADQQAFVEILRESRNDLDRPSYKRLRAGDFQPLKGRTRLSDSELQHLYHAWKRDPFAESAQDAIFALSQALSVSDWQRFRRLLLVEVATTVSMLDSDQPY